MHCYYPHNHLTAFIQSEEETFSYDLLDTLPSGVIIYLSCSIICMEPN